MTTYQVPAPKKREIKEITESIGELASAIADCAFDGNYNGAPRKTLLEIEQKLLEISEMGE